MSGPQIVAGLRHRAKSVLPVLRKLGLAPAADWALRRAAVASAARDNRNLTEAHPGWVLPPPELVFETQGHAEISTWLATGRVAASALVDHLRPLMTEPQPEILDWGAGVGRIMRWLPEFAPDWRVTGAEPNPAAIRWFTTRMPELQVVRTGPRPPLPFVSGRFSAIYTISVFTHLPISVQREWVGELRRVLRPGGILALSLHGARARLALGAQEQADLKAAGIIERTGAQGGSRMFVTCHSERFIREELLEGFRIIAHEQDSPAANGGQDLWVCQIG